MKKSLAVFAAMLVLLATQAVAGGESFFPDYKQLDKAELVKVILQLQQDVIALESTNTEAISARKRAEKIYKDAPDGEKGDALLRMLEAASTAYRLTNLERELGLARQTYTALLSNEFKRKVGANYPSTVDAQEPAPEPSTQWEYKVRALSDVDVGKVEDLENVLTTWGNSGWELVTFSSDIVILKKLK